MSWIIGPIQLKQGSNIQNTTGTSGDRRAGGSWIDWWSGQTGVRETCMGECPLTHNPGAINVCCSLGGHMIINGNPYWLVLPICSAHNASSGTFTLRKDMTAIQITRLPISELETKIPVIASAVHDPHFQTIYMGEENGQPVWSTEYVGDQNDKVFKINT